MAKRKRTHNGLQDITQKTKDRATRTKTGMNSCNSCYKPGRKS